MCLIIQQKTQCITRTYKNIPKLVKISMLMSQYYKGLGISIIIISRVRGQYHRPKNYLSPHT